MSEFDRQQWATARSLLDVAELTARWLEGEIESQPGCHPSCGPDLETEALIPTLAAVNRAGFLTTGSQPGHEAGSGPGEVPGYDGQLWRQRAAVQGFIHPGHLFSALISRAIAADLIVAFEFAPQLRGPGSLDMPGEIVVTACGDEPVTFFGRRHNQYLTAELCPPPAAHDINQAIHLALSDRDFTDSTRLWQVLDDAMSAAAHLQQAPPLTPLRAPEPSATTAPGARFEPESEPEDVVTLFAPQIRITTTNESEFDSLMTWRAELEMAHYTDKDEPHVLVGYVDFLTIRLHEDHLGDLLDSRSQHASEFAPLFDGSDIGAELEATFADAPPVNDVLLIETVYLSKPLRGHDLGSWMLTEVIARMGSAMDTLVLLSPYPAEAPPAGVSDKDAVAALTAHWQWIGLVPIHATPGFLGSTTAFVDMPNARRILEHVEDVQVHVPRSLITDDNPEPRHTIITKTIF